MAKVEIRGVWLTTTDSKLFDSRQNIAAAMDFLAETGFNVVFPVVWNRGATMYPSQLMRQTFDIEINPQFVGRDPLAELVIEARRVGLKVIPWFEYGFASSYNLNGGPLLAKKPEWTARDSKGNLLKKNGFEWLNALDPEVQSFMLNLILEVVQNYDVDGIQADDRLPALPSEGGYDSGTVERYRQQFGESPPKNFKDGRWLQWRADILTEFLARLYQEVKAINSNLLISIAPNIHDWAYKEYLQDSPTWLQRGLVDIIHPQIYRRDFLSYKGIVDKLVHEQFTDATLSKLAPGILMKVGSYRISPEYLLQAIEYNRPCGISGEVFFFYEGLREDNNALAQALRKGPYAQSAAFPSLSELNQVRVSKKASSSLWQQFMSFFRNLFS
ncbi:glycoside hydrolase family 10 protein [Scytonema sp. PCC 10023]|uniref:glycoside hydrolase family 10 protein n=1 Tax=Scytonema sp. PCC 10023 TaxID=1680591 RepID=UPI0039C6F738